MRLLEIGEWDNIESLETDLHTFENGRQKQLALRISQERMSYLINGAGPIVCPSEEKQNSISISYDTQKSIPME